MMKRIKLLILTAVFLILSCCSPEKDQAQPTVNLMPDHLESLAGILLTEDGRILEDDTFLTCGADLTIADGNTIVHKDVPGSKKGAVGVLITFDSTYIAEELRLYSGFDQMEDVYCIYGAENREDLCQKNTLIQQNISVSGEPVSVSFRKKVRYIALFCTGFTVNQRIKEVEIYAKAPAGQKEAVITENTIYTKGNCLFSGENALQLRGVNITELSWSTYGDGDTKEGNSDAHHSLEAALDTWQCRIIRLAVNPSYYLHGGEHKGVKRTAEQYRELVDEFIRRITERKIAVILDCHAYYGVTETVTDFWKLAAPRYDQNELVLYGLLNEPVGSWQTFYEGGATADIDGNPLEVTGMPGLLDCVRALSDNVAVIGGIDYAFDLSCVTKRDLTFFAASRSEALGISAEEYVNRYFLCREDRMGNGIVFDSHVYSNKPEDWDTYLKNALEEYPVLFGEYGPAENKGVITALTESDRLYLRKVFAYMNEHQISSTAWGMSAWPFLRQTNGTVTPFGEAVKQYIQTKKQRG